MLSAPRQHCDAVQIRATNTSPDPVCLSRREHRSKSFQILNGNLLYKKSSFRSHLTHKTASLSHGIDGSILALYG